MKLRLLLFASKCFSPFCGWLEALQERFVLCVPFSRPLGSLATRFVLLQQAPQVRVHHKLAFLGHDVAFEVEFTVF